MATDSTHSRTQIDTHPDLMALRGRYAEASAKPMAGLIEGLCLLTGLYLAISPWVVGFQNFNSLRVSNLITGIALAVLAMGFGSVLERTVGLGWVAIAIGAWTIVAPWVVSGTADTTKTITNNAIVGGVACLLGLATMGLGFMGMSKAKAARRAAH
ncbi:MULTISPECIES: SPW repeat protein [unclassified Streptomyces]|uniref:SPW repeat protein n=1 Tax=unclassified Streptomyces TaxID=2593676 RepID=UPI002E33A90A|nr:SPW repeat protein [Streptomyces sp. NBC_01477]